MGKTDSSRMKKIQVDHLHISCLLKNIWFQSYSVRNCSQYDHCTSVSPTAKLNILCCFSEYMCSYLEQACILIISLFICLLWIYTLFWNLKCVSILHSLGLSIQIYLSHSHTFSWVSLGNSIQDATCVSFQFVPWW